MAIRMVKIWRLGQTSYDTAQKIQLALARKHLDAMMKGQDGDFDTVLLVEHNLPVYTVGIRDATSKEEIQRLRNLGAEFKKTNRGGLMTFHGPGQLVAYPVFNLKHFTTSVKWYVNSLEETIIKLCDDLVETMGSWCPNTQNLVKDLSRHLVKVTSDQRAGTYLSQRISLAIQRGIKAKRSPHTGVWVEENKLAAIGIHASRYVTTHGIALNCNNDLSWFSHIDPCGIKDKGVTSLTQETGVNLSIEKVTPLFLRAFDKVFECKSEDIDTKTQEEILSRVYNNLMAEAENVTVKV